MNLRDQDLVSVQEVRNIVEAASKAQRLYRNFSQQKIDEICQAIAEAGKANSKKLAVLAQKETGYGNVKDKIIKNIFASQVVNDHYRLLKTIGVINADYKNRVIDIAEPVGVIAGLESATSPTSSVFYQAITSLKVGDAIVFAPRPEAKNSVLKTVNIIRKALRAENVPVDLVSSLRNLTPEAELALVNNQAIKLILAAPGMKPASALLTKPILGEKKGNGPVFIEKSANVSLTVKRIVDSKSFDFGTSNASEQSILVDQLINKRVENEFRQHGGYFLSDSQKTKVARLMASTNGSMNPKIVGKSAQQIAKLSGFDLPTGVKVLIAKENLKDINRQNPFVKEKLAPILTLFVVDTNRIAIETANKLLKIEGEGQTAMIHSENKHMIVNYCQQVHASKVMVNTAASLGEIGATANLHAGTQSNRIIAGIGGISPLDLANVKQETFGIREVEDIKQETAEENKEVDTETEQAVVKIVKQVIKEIRNKNVN